MPDSSTIYFWEKRCFYLVDSIFLFLKFKVISMSSLQNSLQNSLQVLELSKKNSLQNSNSLQMLKLSSFRIPCVSSLQILHDLVDCVTHSRTKVDKRIQRLTVMCTLIGVDPEIYISNLKICKEKTPLISINDIKEFISKPLPIHENERVIFDHSPADDSIKKLLEARLTTKLNADLILYKITCGIVSRLFCKIKRHPTFKALVANKQIILVHGGGIAQRLVLTNEYPEHRALIEKYFGLGGDNDCCLLLDPFTENYDGVYKELVEFVWNFIMKEINCFSYGVVNAYANAVTSIEVMGETLKVTPTDRNHFVISSSKEDPKLSYMDVHSDKNCVYATRNETLEFKDETGRLCKFTLERIKKAFKIGERVIGAEILDISIPHKKEEKILSNFGRYKSGEWIKDVYL